MVGLPRANLSFVDDIVKYREKISEVYFSFGDFANGRSSQTQQQDSSHLPWELQEIQLKTLGRLTEEGIALNLLFNGNCYGKHSLSRAFFDRVGQTTDYLCTRFALCSVTTTSPLIARFIRRNFEGLEVRASVNMEIGTIPGMDYLADYFDGYYMKREWNRDFVRIEELSGWCHANGKKLYLLANSGCLNHCSAHTFHDNLVAHEAEIAQMDNVYTFGGICKEYLKKEENYPALIENTNFIRPEDMAKYEPFFDGVKLATRVHRNPSMVLKSYCEGHYSGNILELLEPAHSIYPYVIENGEPLRLRRIDTDTLLYGNFAES